jgi:hypothetical protein
MSLKTERETNLKVRAMKSRGLEWPPRLGMFADNLEGYDKHAQAPPTKANFNARAHLPHLCRAM